jgi:hypothetical protein
MLTGFCQGEKMVQGDGMIALSLGSYVAASLSEYRT